MQKRVISGILALALVLTLALTLAQADVRVELDGIDGGSASVTVPEDDSAALLEGYTLSLLGEDGTETELLYEETQADGEETLASFVVDYTDALSPVRVIRLLPVELSGVMLKFEHGGQIA